MDVLRDLAAVVVGPSDKMSKVNLFETQRFFCDAYVLRPGQLQAPHAHAASDKVYAVLAGAGEIRVGADTHVVRAGHVVLCPAGIDHGVANPGTVEMRLLVFMAPHPKPPAAPTGARPG